LLLFVKITILKEKEFRIKLDWVIFRLGYEGFHMKRTQDYFKEGEATFYRTSRFILKEHSLNRLADLVNKVWC